MTASRPGPDPRSPVRRHVAGALAMVLGTSGVFGLMLLLNATATLPEEEDSKEVVAFEVKAPPPPPDRPKPKPKRTPPKRRDAPAPPSGLLAAGVGGLDFGLGDAGGWSALGDELIGEVNDVVMTDEAVDEQPRPLEQAPPDYPRRARAQGIAGRVVLSFLIGRDGAVQDARVLSAEPPGWFEDAALAAVRAWTFEPARYQGAPVPVRREIPLDFDLQ